MFRIALGLILCFGFVGNVEATGRQFFSQRVVQRSSNFVQRVRVVRQRIVQPVVQRVVVRQQVVQPVVYQTISRIEAVQAYVPAVQAVRVRVQRSTGCSSSGLCNQLLIVR